MGKNLCALAEKNDKICAITAAMCGGTGLECFHKKFPERMFDVGIAEAHAVTFFAGLSAAGMKPCFAVYSTFLQRAYDNILHDVALQKLGGVFLIDRAGFATEDGATHHGLYDTAFLSQAEGITIYEPQSYKAFYSMMKKATDDDGLYAIRYPKGAEDEEIISAFGVDENDDFMPLFCGADESGKLPSNVIITYGRITREALAAKEILSQKGISVGIILLQTLKPLDIQLDKIIGALKTGGGKVAFLEEGVLQGSVSMLLQQKLCEKGALTDKKCKIFALDGKVPEQATLCHLYEKCRISHKDIISFISED
jgi:1-deoxy-D-xylulose-5-phosphate synthase